MEISVDKIIIADDHPMFRNALKQSITSNYDCEVIECASLESLRSELKAHNEADLLILDLNMPGADGFSSLVYVQEKYPHLPIIMISANDKLDVIRTAKSFGALGFISKSANIETIREAIKLVLQGDTFFPIKLESINDHNQDTELLQLTKGVADLTPQQYKVLQMLKRGLLNKQIAYDLEVSEATIKAHVTAIMRKLGANNRTQAVMKVVNIELKDQF
ncbi:MAG: response regulator transcription factor [Alcanivoracaceae bacterium]|nr:response regulator transcription factor [Alcanivoracaceae bacterium]